MTKVKKEKYDTDGMRLQVFNKGEYLPIENDDEVSNLLQLGIKVINETGGRPLKYDNSEGGFTSFVERSKAYLQFIHDTNNSPESKRKLMPDIESWCVYLGISRGTLMSYGNRGGNWTSFINYFKGVIFSVKKLLAQNFKCPPVTFIFDAVNNFDYRNVSEFKLEANVSEGENEQITADLAKYNLIWDEEKGEYVSGS